MRRMSALWHDAYSCAPSSPPSNSHNCPANFALGFAIFPLTVTTSFAFHIVWFFFVASSLFIYSSNFLVCLSECGVWRLLFFNDLSSIYPVTYWFASSAFVRIIWGLGFGSLGQWLLFSTPVFVTVNHLFSFLHRHIGVINSLHR
jgi:hypothetical protein